MAPARQNRLSFWWVVHAPSGFVHLEIMDDLGRGVVMLFLDALVAAVDINQEV